MSKNTKPRDSKRKPYHNDADLAAPSVTLSLPYVDHEGPRRATPVRNLPTLPANPSAQRQYNAPASYAYLTQPTMQPAYSSVAGSRDTTYHGQHYGTASARGVTNTTNTNTMNTTSTNHYNRASCQVQEAPSYTSSNDTAYNGSEPAGSVGHATADSSSRQPYGAARPQHGVYDTGIHASSTLAAGSSRHSEHIAHHHGSVAGANPTPISSSSLQVHFAAASASSHRGQSSHPIMSSSTAVQIRPELNFEWTFPTMTTGHASYQQYASGLAPPADYPFAPSDGARLQPPRHQRAMDPPPGPSHRPATGRSRSNSVQQVSNPSASHTAAASFRPRRVSHAVPPSTIKHPSRAHAVLPSGVAHQMGSSSFAHDLRVYSEPATAEDSRARPSRASQVVSPGAEPSCGSQDSAVQPPAHIVRTRKGKEPLKPLFTRKPLQFKRPAENSRPSSLIQSDHECENSREQDHSGEGQRYTTLECRRIRRAVKRMKAKAYTQQEVYENEPTDVDIIEKSAELLSYPHNIPEVKSYIKGLVEEEKYRSGCLRNSTALYFDTQTR